MLFLIIIIIHICSSLRVWNSGMVEWMTLSTRVVLFTVSGSLAKRAVRKQTAPKKKKSTLYLVRTKASELADFPGENTP